MKTKYIAAIEIGSSKIKGIVAAVDSSTSINVLAIESADAEDIVRYGRVQNETEAGSRINEIIRRLENNPRLARGTVKSVFVAEGGRSVRSYNAEATVSQGSEAEITAQTVQRLKKEARYNLATDRDILEISPRRYFVDNAEVKKINGAFGNVIKGEFTIVTASPENRRRLDRIKIESHGTEIPRKYIPRTIALADTVLSDSDRQLGCMLIDFGAETTTLAVYRDDALQMLTTLPMGSMNINHDLCVGLGITEETAENIKINKGEAIVERSQLSRDEETNEIINFVSARVGEIIANITNQLELANIKAQDLKAGIVLAGGGSRLRGFIEMLEAQTNIKVRRAVADASIYIDAVSAADNLDVISLVKYIALNHDADCIDFPDNEPQTLVEETKNIPNQEQPQQKMAGRQVMNLDHPDLLKDDEDFDDDDTPFDDEEDGELPPPGKTAAETRKTLLSKLKDWLNPPVDDGLDDDEEEDN